MVLNGGISTVLVSFTVLSTLPREKVFSDLSPAQTIFLLIMMLFYCVSILYLIELFPFQLTNPGPCQYAMFPVVLEIIMHMHYLLSQA